MGLNICGEEIIYIPTTECHAECDCDSIDAHLTRHDTEIDLLKTGVKNSFTDARYETVGKQIQFTRADGSQKTLTIDGGGSDVTVTPVLTEGTKIATITVDGEATDIFSNEGTIEEVAVNGETIATEGIANIEEIPAEILTGEIPNDVTAVTQEVDDVSQKIATTEFVDKIIKQLPTAMVFKGSLGDDGTISTLPTATEDNEGHTYIVITEGTYSGKPAKEGDLFVSNGSEWVLVPAGQDIAEGTVTSIKLQVNEPLKIDNDAPITTSGVRTISHDVSGATAGSYGDSENQTPDYGETFKVPYVEVDKYGHITSVTEHTVEIPNEIDISDKADVDETGSALWIDGTTLKLKNKYGTTLSTVETQDTTYSNVTTTSDGLMTKADKVKLDGIEEGANNYELPIASATELGGIKVGDNLSIDGDGKLSATDTTYEKVTTTADGLMSKEDKAKLDNISENATEVDVTAELDDGVKLATITVDGENTDIYTPKSVGSVIVTKKATEGVNIADITIDGETTSLYAPKGGEGGSTVSVTATKTSGDKLATITVDGVPTNIYSNNVPTKTSQLTNDSNFVNEDDLDTKVDKETGKGLSTNDYTTAEKTKLAGISENANKTEVTQVLTEGTKIASVSIDGSATDLYSPKYTAGNGIDITSGYEVKFKAPIIVKRYSLVDLNMASNQTRQFQNEPLPETISGYTAVGFVSLAIISTESTAHPDFVRIYNWGITNEQLWHVNVRNASSSATNGLRLRADILWIPSDIVEKS